MKNAFTKHITTNTYQYGFSMPDASVFKTTPGLSTSVVEEISLYKSEPAWMREFRLKSFNIFQSKPMPSWGGDLAGINFDAMTYYVRPTDRLQSSWDQVPQDIKTTFDRLGIPEAEKKFLAGVGAQYDSEVIYHNLRQDLQRQGVLFLSMDEGLRQHPDIVRQYMGTLVPPGDNKFAALNSAVWSGGSFVCVPAGVQVKTPLQAYFRINAERMGQFERTLIIAEEGSFVHYIEGCTAPTYTTDNLHSAVVEIFVKKGARVRYTTVQNWSKNVYNLVTKRAKVEAEGVMEWIDFNGGSKLTMKYPSVVLVGEGAKGEILSIALAGSGQHQDAGGKAIHVAPHTTSKIISKSISNNGGRTSYRGLVRVCPRAEGARSFVRCDALILDPVSRSDTYPTMQLERSDATIEHEAVVSKIGEEQLWYLRTRGLSENDARSLIVNGFIEPLARELPMEYAVELNRLIAMEMENKVG